MKNREGADINQNDLLIIIILIPGYERHSG